MLSYGRRCGKFTREKYLKATFKFELLEIPIAPNFLPRNKKKPMNKNMTYRGVNEQVRVQGQYGNTY